MSVQMVVNTEDDEFEFNARCDFCGTEHGFRVYARQMPDEGRVEITIESVHSSTQMYSPRLIQ